MPKAVAFLIFCSHRLFLQLKWISRAQTNQVKLLRLRDLEGPFATLLTLISPSLKNAALRWSGELN